MKPIEVQSDFLTCLNATHGNAVESEKVRSESDQNCWSPPRTLIIFLEVWNLLEKSKFHSDIGGRKRESEQTPSESDEVRSEAHGLNTKKESGNLSCYFFIITNNHYLLLAFQQ